MNTTGNTIFISGGSAGIGYELAKYFSEKGNKVIINGRNQQRLDKARNSLPNAITVQGDLSSGRERVRIANTLIKDHPDVNVVINNAGEAYAYSLASTGEAYANAQGEINTNYLAVIHFTELLTATLLSKENAAIVNVTSIVGLIPGNAAPTYSSSKAALHFYTQSLRNALASTNLKVFELMPPLVNTQFSAPIGGANGIPPNQVAEALLYAMEHDQFDVPVGQTINVYNAIQQGLSKLKK